MSDLLPPNATPLERNLVAATARISDVPLKIRESWNPDTCPLELLPWLAWALSVDEWRSDWTEENKRSVIKSAFDVQRRKGTVGSVKTVRDAFGFSDGVLLEGVAAGLTWAEYKLQFARLISKAVAAPAIRALNGTAPARCRQKWDFTAVPLKYDGTADYDGSYTHGEIYG